MNNIERKNCKDYRPYDIPTSVTNFQRFTRSPHDLAILLEQIAHKPHSAEMFEEWLNKEAFT